MTSTDYLKMPSLVENRVEVFMDDNEKKIYERMKAEMIVRLGEKEIDAVNAAALSNKLLQMANGAVYDADRQILKVHEKKLEALGDLIEGANGKPVLIAYWYKHDLERIKNKFFVREIKSEKEISDWNAGKISVGAIHPASAGHGLNLQSGGSTIIWFCPLLEKTDRKIETKNEIKVAFQNYSDKANLWNCEDVPYYNSPQCNGKQPILPQP